MTGGEIPAEVLGALLDGAGVGVAVLDRDGRYLHVNERLATLNGVAAEHHLGRTLHEVIPHIADAVAALHADVLRTGRPRLDVQLRGTTPGAPDRIWQANYLPTVLDGETVVGVVITDVTDRERATATLAARRRDVVLRSLDREENERRRLADVLHDDVLQHLLFARQELWATGDNGDAASRARTSLDEATTLLRAVVGALHPVTLAHAGLDAALEHLAAQVRAGGGPVVEIEVGSGAGGADDRLVMSLARELLANVVEHSGASRAVLSLTSEETRVRLRIADDGRGMPADTFEVALAGGATGLPMIRERVEALGGRARIGPGLGGRGTAVEVEFPTEDHPIDGYPPGRAAPILSP